MSDIVQMLNEKALDIPNSLGDRWGDWICKDAAKEIVRLRAERDRLRAEVQALARDALGAGCQAWENNTRAVTAEAERDKLRDEDDATRRALGERFTLVPPDGGDVKTHEAAKAAIETLAVVERERDRSTEAHERAAAERDRLRNVDDIGSEIYCESEIKALRAEVGELQQTTAEWREAYEDVAAERDRLRDALAKTDEERAKDARPVIHAALKGDTP